MRNAQVAVAEGCARGAWVDTDDLNSGMNKIGITVENDLHLTPDGYRTLGERLAEKALALLAEKD